MGEQIEITPEMVKAAAAVVSDRCNDGFWPANRAQEIAEMALEAAFASVPKCPN